MSRTHETRLLLDEREALSDYLDSLLQAVPEADRPPADHRRAHGPDRPETAAVPLVGTAPEAAPVRSGPPDWVEGSFQCLTLNVAGLTLAVPLVKLNGIIEMPADVTPMPGHQPWFLGLVRHLDRQVKVVDIGRIVLPEGRPYAPVDATRVVLIDEGRWGIACQDGIRMITLSPDGVRWRSGRGKRPWLAGTVIEHMCAILDVDVLASELTTGQWASAASATKRAGS